MSLTIRFQSAFDYAFELHNGQLRKSTPVPYIAHLMSVAGLVLEDGGDEDEAIAALLHDAVEDQGGQTTLAEIHRRFGDRVAAIVLGCSDSDTIPKPPWRQRKELYLAHLRDADQSVLRVSLADKIHNARDLLFTYRQLGETVWEQFAGGKAGTLWYYRALVEIFQERRPGALATEFERIVHELSRLAGDFSE